MEGKIFPGVYWPYKVLGQLTLCTKMQLTLNFDKAFNKFNASGKMWYWRPEAEGSDRVLIVVITCVCGTQ